MQRIITVIYDGEVFRPTEPVDLAPNTKGVAILHADSASDDYPLLRLAELAKDMDLPSDLAEQHDHYLYGTPKR